MAGRPGGKGQRTGRPARVREASGSRPGLAASFTPLRGRRVHQVRVMRVEGAIQHGQQAPRGQRKSIPFLYMAGWNLTKVLNERYPKEDATAPYLDRPPHSRGAVRPPHLCAQLTDWNTARRSL